MAILPKAVVTGARKLVREIGLKGIERASETLRPVIREAVVHHRENKNSLIDLTRVIDLKVSEASEYLRKLGFAAHPVLLRPRERLKNALPDMVLNVVPKKGRAHADTLVKLYYADQAVIDRSEKMTELPNVVGMPLEAATDLLEAARLHVLAVLAKPKVEYAGKPVGSVVQMKPAPSLVLRSVGKGSVIRLIYIDEGALEDSRELLRIREERAALRREKIAGAVAVAGNLLARKKKNQ